MNNRRKIWALLLSAILILSFAPSMAFADEGETPEGTSVSKLTPSNKAFTVTWEKQSAKMSGSRITGYQIQYSTEKSFSSGRKIKVKGYKNTSCKVGKLKANTKYYVRIRTYTEKNNKTYYSAWSGAKTAVTPKASPYRPRILVLDDDKSDQDIVRMLNRNGCRAEMLWTRYIDVSRYDGLVIPGGHNIDPRMYGAERDPETYGTDINKDIIQIDMIKKFVKAKKPVLGVCRGCQVVNVALGGTIDQHIPGWHKWNRTVKISKSSWLYDAYGSRASVYHFHHQCVERLGKGMAATQWDAGDGRIEAIEHRTLPVYGVQWHPDSMGSSGDPVFIEFKKVCVRQKKKNDAARTPQKTAITAAAIGGKTIKITWKQAKNAEKYKVYVQTGDDGWKYSTTVYKNGENREYFADKLKYKLKTSGNKYIVYVRKNPYKEVKTLKGTSYTFTGKSGKKYTFVIRSENGIVHSAYSAPRTVVMIKP